MLITIYKKKGLKKLEILDFYYISYLYLYKKNYYIYIYMKLCLKIKDGSPIYSRIIIIHTIKFLYMLWFSKLQLKWLAKKLKEKQN